jgi:hypothetical protein
MIKLLHRIAASTMDYVHLSLKITSDFFIGFNATVIFGSGGLGLQRFRIQALPYLCQWQWMFCPLSAYRIKPSWSEPKIKPTNYPTKSNHQRSKSHKLANPSQKSPKIFLLVGRSLNYTMVGSTFLPIRILKYPTITGIPL